MNRRRNVRTATLAAACAVALVAAPAAQAGRTGTAGGADRIVSSGLCSQGGEWLMTARAKRQGIVVSIRIRGGRPGDTWRFAVRHNDKVIFGKRRAAGHSGVGGRRRTANLPGVDVYTFIARDRSTKETCIGGLTY